MSDREKERKKDEEKRDGGRKRERRGREENVKFLKHLKRNAFDDKDDSFRFSKNVSSSPSLIVIFLLLSFSLPLT